MKCSRAALSAIFAMTSFAALAADYPAPKQGDWIASDFKFHSGETMPELRPTAMAARNWMLRRMMLETIRNDPDYNGGNYTAQPRMMKYAINAYAVATGGGTLAYQTLAPTAAKADKMVDDRLAAAITADANDFLYRWDASHDYDPSPGLEKIEATLLAINAADDERNPPETGITDAAMKHIKNGRLYLIPASTETRGHLTTGNAAFYKQQLQELLATAPQRTM
jgi:homoserine O-acetyltransferase